MLPVDGCVRMELVYKMVPWVVCCLSWVMLSTRRISKKYGDFVDAHTYAYTDSQAHSTGNKEGHVDRHGTILYFSEC